jgi:hypothetical protein
MLPVRVVHVANEEGDAGSMMKEAQRVIETTRKDWEVEWVSPKESA